MLHPLSTLFLGLILGLTHALEADHLLAVSILLKTSKNPFKAALVGMYWGIGHTTTLFIVGLVVLVLHISIPQAVSTGLEGFVGLMLILLGIITLRKKTEIIHEHEHDHNGEPHTHMHANHTHRHHRSFFIGTVHGLAGSGALMVLVLSGVNSVLEGVIYIIVFGTGSIIGMSMMSLIFGLSVSYSQRFTRINHAVHLVLGFISLGFGGFVVYKTLVALRII